MPSPERKNEKGCVGQTLGCDLRKRNVSKKGVLLRGEDPNYQVPKREKSMLNTLITLKRVGRLNAPAFPGKVRHKRSP